MRYIRLIGTMLLIAQMQSCANYKSKQQAKSINLPELGSIIQIRGNFWYATSEQVGTLQWSDPLNVTVKQLPFSKTSYASYARYIQQSQQINSIAYVDSLPHKPKYLRLQLVDQIGLTQLLNSPQNSTVRSYLEGDSDYKIVTALSITIEDALLPMLKNAKAVLLEQDAQKNQHLIIDNGTQKKEIDLIRLQVFDMEYASFCWSEDRYHRKIVKALVSKGQGCPNDTHKKATKVASDRSLKF